MRHAKRKYTEQLSPIFCTPEMKEKVLAVAQKENITISEIQRRALDLFLRRNYSKSSEIHS